MDEPTTTIHLTPEEAWLVRSGLDWLMAHQPIDPYRTSQKAATEALIAKLDPALAAVARRPPFWIGETVRVSDWHPDPWYGARGTVVAQDTDGAGTLVAVEHDPAGQPRRLDTDTLSAVPHRPAPALDTIDQF